MPDTPAAMSQDQITEAVRDLPGWEGDEHRLQRTVELPRTQVDGVVDAVHDAEAELNHHTQIESLPTGSEGAVLTFRVWTHSVGGVTQKDVDLARKISAAVGPDAEDVATGDTSTDVRDE